MIFLFSLDFTPFLKGGRRHVRVNPATLDRSPAWWPGMRTWTWP